MKKILIPIAFLLLIGCTPAPDTIDLEVTVEGWSFEYSGPDYENYEPEIDTYNFTVSKGDEFEPPYMLGGWSDDKLFTVKKIIDETSVKLSFLPDDIVVKGEEITQESAQNPIVIGAEPTCFVTRAMDSGDDICVRVIAETSP
jgi:hypothetical protein